MALARAVFPGDFEFPGVGALEQDVAFFLRELVPGAVRIDTELLHQLAPVIGPPARFFRGFLSPGFDCALFDAQGFIGHDEGRVKLEARAQAIAVVAHALGRVEGKGLGGEFREGDSAVRAGGALGEGPVAFALGHNQGSRANAQGGLYRVGDPRSEAGADDDAIDHGLHRVLPSFVQAFQFVALNDLAVDAQADPSRPPRLGEEFPKLALAVDQERSQQSQAAAFRPGKDFPGNLFGALAGNPVAALVAVLDANACVQNPQVVGDFGNGAHRRAWVVARGFLLDGDSWGEPANGFVTWLLHLAEKLPRVSREGFHVTTLAFGVEGVEGEGGFPRAGHAGHDYELFLWDANVNVLEVVFPGALDVDVVEFHGSLFIRRARRPRVIIEDTPEPDPPPRLPSPRLDFPAAASARGPPAQFRGRCRSPGSTGGRGRGRGREDGRGRARPQTGNEAGIG